MKTNKLIKNIIDQIKEAQIKLGYVKETVRLYYPLSSLNALLETDFQSAEELVADLADKFQNEKQNEKEITGRISLNFRGDRIEVSVSPEGVRYIHEEIKDSEFLVDIIELFQNHHSCTLEQIQQIFEKYSNEYTCEKMPENSDFDYVLHFLNTDIDEYYYCVKMEMGHTIYHRFTKSDYELIR